MADINQVPDPYRTVLYKCSEMARENPRLALDYLLAAFELGRTMGRLEGYDRAHTVYQAVYGTTAVPIRNTPISEGEPTK